MSALPEGPPLPRAVEFKLEMWANAQSDGRPAEYRWRPLFNAAVWLTPTTRVPCSNAAKTRNQLKLEMWANAQPDGRPAEYR